MSSASFFPSSESQKRWKEHMRHNYISNHGIRPCVFQVPDYRKDTNLEAYIPQFIGLGPYHHFRPELQLMESKKRAAVSDYLKIVDFDHFIYLVDNSHNEFEPIIRSCYDQYLDLDKETLSWVLNVDGIVLLHLIDTCLGPKAEKNRIYSDVEKLVPDVFMLENQIPIVLILEMRKVLGPSFSVSTDDELSDKFHRFCSEYSPLELTSVAEHREEAFDKNNHMLHYMYHMIMKNKGPGNPLYNYESETEEDRRSERENRGTLKNRAEVIARVAVDHVSELFQQIVEEFNSAIARARSAGIEVPGNVQKASQLLQKLDKALQVLHSKKDLPGDKIEIPSVSRIVALLNIKFKPLPAGSGIRDVSLKSSDFLKFKLYLPVIHMRASSEAILSNLIAYEATISKHQRGPTRLGDFVDLMSGIIKSEKDVQLLKDEKIITEELPNEEIVKIFNRIAKADEMPYDRSNNVQSTVVYVNNRVRYSRFINCWKGLSKSVAFMVKIFRALFPLFIVIFLAFQSVCEVVDCRVRPNGGAAMRNLYFGDSLEIEPEAKLMLPRKVLGY